jgi:signal transduction histidine kinase
MIFKTFTHELKTPLNGITLSLETSQHITHLLLKKLEENSSKN